MPHLRQSDTKKIDGVDLTHIYSAANQRMFKTFIAFCKFLRKSVAGVRAHARLIEKVF
jgi:hypothetical protein